MMVSAESRTEEGFSLIALLAVMTLVVIALLAVAPSVQLAVERERELEAIRRGEEVAEAIRQYVEFYQGTKLPKSIDDLLEGLPEGTKKRMILRASAATDPLSEDGKWRLITPQSTALLNFGKRVQSYNNGLLPPNGSQMLDRFVLPFVNVINSRSRDDLEASGAEGADYPTSGVDFIGVATSSRRDSVISYYGIESRSRWVFSPLFRGVNAAQIVPMRGPNPRFEPNLQIIPTP